MFFVRNEERSFLVGRTEIFEHARPTDPKGILNFLAGFINGMKDAAGEILSETRISIREYPGREAVFVTPAGVFTRTRLYFVRDRVFSVSAVAPRREALDDPLARRFFASFEVK